MVISDYDHFGSGQSNRHDGDVAAQRRQYIAAVLAYLKALDVGDVDAAVRCFAHDANLTCETTDMRLEGAAKIEDFLRQISEDSVRMKHRISGAVVDTERRKCAVELHYIDKLRGGRVYDMNNCNFFDFNPAGEFVRVRFWMGSPVE